MVSLAIVRIARALDSALIGEIGCVGGMNGAGKMKRIRLDWFEGIWGSLLAGGDLFKRRRERLGWSSRSS
jgi:hypothetical protein